MASKATGMSAPCSAQRRPAPPVVCPGFGLVKSVFIGIRFFVVLENVQAVVRRAPPSALRRADPTRPLCVRVLDSTGYDLKIVRWCQLRAVTQTRSSFWEFVSTCFRSLFLQIFALPLSFPSVRIFSDG